MGADYPGQEAAINELRALSPAAKRFLEHHICNGLTAVIGGMQIGNHKIAEEAAWHIVEDLETAGIRHTQKEINQEVTLSEK